jgi:2-keto-4-pentenoate hydratase/2-oxohepta-3-ene-1,7-dioic acid hydratase in catechol pathway
MIRTTDGWFVLRDQEGVAVSGGFTTTGALLTEGMERVRHALSVGTDGVPVARLVPLSPVTTPCRVVAQAVNFRSHAREVGLDDAAPPVFFRKSSGAFCGPTDDVVRPAHVRLLDYEVEVGLVMRGLDIGADVADEDLPGHVAGIVLTNEISARDLQLEQGQFYEGKSYPTFQPTGPYLVLLDPDEFGLLPDLRLRLAVNGEVRQDATMADVITPPARALTLLARFQRLDAGDLLLTGTPAGTALKAPPRVVEKFGGLLPARLKWRIFFARQARRREYLQAGDVITASVSTPDGALDLGTQRTVVR